MLSTRKGRAGAAVLAASVVAGGIALGVGPASATTSTLFTVTAVSPHLVAATTANQVITLTGTGFNEDDLAGVTIGGCTTAPSYIAVSPTTLVLKTASDCVASTGGVVITLTDTSSTAGATYSTTAATAGTKLDFVTPPSLVAVPADVTTATGTLPVVSLNTAKQMPVNQVVTAPITGGTTIKVTAGTNKFSQSTAFPLAASLGGVALTGVTGYTAAGTVVTSGSVDYFTGKVGAHGAGAVALSVTNAGVTKTFPSSATGFSYAGTTISVAPAFGPTDGGNVIKITGAGFVVGGTGASTVAICGVNAPVVATGSTATLLNVTVPAFSDPAGTTAATAIDGSCTIKVTTAGLASIVNGGSTYTYVAQG